MPRTRNARFTCSTGGSSRNRSPPGRINQDTVGRALSGSAVRTGQGPRHWHPELLHDRHVAPRRGASRLASFSVTQRTREIGIRMALGARPATVWRLILTQGAKPVVIGSAVGVTAALLLASLAAA